MIRCFLKLWECLLNPSLLNWSLVNNLPPFLLWWLLFGVFLLRFLSYASIPNAYIHLCLLHFLELFWTSTHGDSFSFFFLSYWWVILFVIGEAARNLALDFFPFFLSYWWVISFVLGEALPNIWYILFSTNSFSYLFPLC